MNEKEKKSYLESYKAAKEKGVPFFPDIIFKDTIVVLLVFIILVCLVVLIGAPLEERANPNDTSYTPRPEWYFLFLFQLLKYFPGNLEVLGVMVLPGIVILLLLVLPFFDRSPKRHFINRPFATVAACFVVIGIVALSFLAASEAPPPKEAVIVDRAAALYAANCANCHGPSVTVKPGDDLHQIIASGNHEGMPAWGGDLSSDEIDSLVGFILSPNGNIIYNQQCATCHKQMIQAVGNPVILKQVLQEGTDFPEHQDQPIPDWNETLSNTERNALLNFLAAPDGQRLFVINCSGCHGQGVAFDGTEKELVDLISKGGQHLEMPAWQGKLSEDDIQTLAAYVVDPHAEPNGQALFEKHCVSCHGNTIPYQPDIDTAIQIISSGGAHMTMPVWGDILTPEQLDALVKYTMEASKGVGTAAGAQLFADNCSTCHGEFGEGGPNPSRPGDIIPPISTSEYLKTRDDITLHNIISQGQPNFGMSPFGSENGGPLDDDQISSIVAFIRSWEANPPVDIPPEIAANPTEAPSDSLPKLSGAEIFADVCANCHGDAGQGGIGPGFNTEAFQNRYTDEELFDTISNGHKATAMIAWGEFLTSDQIQQLVQLIRAIQSTEESEATPVSFKNDVLPIFEAQCRTCHSEQNTFGGWDSSSYETVMSSGKDAPVIIPNDTLNSILLQRIMGTSGNKMPPKNDLDQADIQIILNWIAAGALDN